MMKLTVAFLAALAVADASNVRHRHVRRQYGYGEDNTSAVFTAPANSTSTLIPSTTADAATKSPVETPLDTTTASPAGPTTDKQPSGVPGVSFPGYGTAPGTAPGNPATELSPEQPSNTGGFTFPGTGTAPALPATETPAAETTSLSPVGGKNSTSTFPTFVLTGTEGSFPTGVPSGVFPTATGAEDLVTVTISSTQIFTVTACPDTVTDCPAKSTSLVTKVVPVATTVCPSSVASSISASGLPSSAPATVTGTATGVDAATTPSPSEVVENVTETLTYTIGTGENAHETTYTVTNKVTKTIYVTGTGEAAVPVTDVSATGGAEPTTYVTQDLTSTVAKTLTITEGLPTGTGIPASGNDVPAGETGECAPPVTVTVTAQETVTVTAGQESSTATAIPDDVPSDETTTSAAPEQTSSSAVPDLPTAIPTGAPYPVNNGSAPHFPGSSGFLTHTKPTGPAPTGGAPGYGPGPIPSGTGVAPSGPAPTEGLPSFVLPTATPAGEEAPTTTSVSPEAPAETTGYGYGSKRGLFGLF